METPSRVRISPAPPYEQLTAAPGASLSTTATPEQKSPVATRPPDLENTPGAAQPYPPPPQPYPLQPHRPHPRAVSPATAAARRFAAETAAVIVEVLDRRRNVAQLRSRVTAPVLEQFTALVRSAPLRGVEQVGVVRRVHIQMCDPTAAEVFGSYARGGRVRAFVCRVEWLPCRVRIPAGRYQSSGTRTEDRWQVVDFAII